MEMLNILTEMWCVLRQKRDKMASSKALAKLDGPVTYITNHAVKPLKPIIAENGHTCNCSNNANINLRIVHFVHCESPSYPIIL